MNGITVSRYVGITLLGVLVFLEGCYVRPTIRIEEGPGHAVRQTHEDGGMAPPYVFITINTQAGGELYGDGTLVTAVTLADVACYKRVKEGKADVREICPPLKRTIEPGAHVTIGNKFSKTVSFCVGSGMCVEKDLNGTYYPDRNYFYGWWGGSGVYTNQGYSYYHQSAKVEFTDAEFENKFGKERYAEAVASWKEKKAADAAKKTSVQTPAAPTVDGNELGKELSEAKKEIEELKRAVEELKKEKAPTGKGRKFPRPESLK